MRTALLVMFLVGCWSSSPARFSRPTPTPELMPDGAWLVVGAEFDTSKSTSQREREKQVLSDPSSVETAEHGCQMPASHAAFAVYGHDSYAFVGRGVFVPSAMLACFEKVSKGNHAATSWSSIEHQDVLITGTGRDAYVQAATDTGLVLVAREPIMRRLLGASLHPVTLDPAIGPLIAHARANSQVWAAALLPANEPVVHEVLEELGVTLVGRVISVTASINFVLPLIEVELELETAADGTTLAAALEAKRAQLVALDPHLAKVLGVLAVESHGTHLSVVGHPAALDWLEAYQALLAAIAALTT